MSTTPRLSPGRMAALLVAVFVVLAGSAMLRTSVTFDEIVFSAVGARGFVTGDFNLVNDHPRLAQYLFGVPAWLAADHFPPEQGAAWNWYSRYHYARALLWGSGNFPERIIVATRLVGLAFGALTVLATFLLSRRHTGAAGALFAAGLVAFLPDMLAHSGVAYNDIPLAFGLLASVYAIDAAARDPTMRRVALAALACALTACVKYSGLIVGPVLVALLFLEAISGRWRDPQWRRAILRAVPIFIGVAYLTVALLYLGDWGLADFRRGLSELSRSSTAGRVAFLLGERNVGGWWYFFPVAFVLKTPMALHVFMVLAVAGAWIASRGGRWRQWAAHGARAPAAGALLFVSAVMLSGFNIGVRHMLPAMPLICILVAQGVAPLWERARGAARAALGLVFAALVASSASQYPWFISYLSEYAAGRPVHETLVDSSTDWGQGLVALRGFMRERGIDEVALGYFGSALPQGYGIKYVTLPSFLELPGEAARAPGPRYIVVSATLLVGNYVRGDPYRVLRASKPLAIVGGTLYVFDRDALGKL